MRLITLQLPNEVVKRNSEEGTFWDYLLVHGDKTTSYTVSFDSKTKIAGFDHKKAEFYPLSDSIDCGEDIIYVYDIPYEKKPGLQGFFCIHPFLGLMSVSPFDHGNYMDHEGYPSYKQCIERYRLMRLRQLESTSEQKN